MAKRKAPKLDKDGAMALPEFLDRRKELVKRPRAKTPKTTPAPRVRVRPKT